VHAPDDCAGLRIDRFLRRQLPHVPLSRIYRMIRTGGVRVGGKQVGQQYRLAAADAVEMAVAAEEVRQENVSRSEAVARLAGTAFFRTMFRVVFEDECLIVCDKPPGLVVHPGSGHPSDDSLIELAQAHMLRSRAGADRRPYLVHRLDRDTSGVILIAKDRAGLVALHEAMREGRIDKRYECVCHGAPRRPAGVIELNLAKTFERNDGTKVTAAENGQFSRSRYTVVQTRGGLSLVAVRLETGRTHQIRVHMAHIGCPIVGDVRYGDAAADGRLPVASGPSKRLYLHAHSITFPHPLSRQRITVDSPRPEQFRALLDSVRP